MGRPRKGKGLPLVQMNPLALLLGTPLGSFDLLYQARYQVFVDHQQAKGATLLLVLSNWSRLKIDPIHAGLDLSKN